MTSVFGVNHPSLGPIDRRQGVCFFYSLWLWFSVHLGLGLVQSRGGGAFGVNYHNPNFIHPPPHQSNYVSTKPFSENGACWMIP
ncbi:hypothetical protein F5050DRAFT_822209 [Lentinula boryana]|uniref:Uncharacterized protein n=1 Tax=Lentinula boryana TaxID=40481 RepID=A0ABQ8Q2Y6_9AGAR|nr:hypothetical protein F5050DRAFT_822209 [Lentinula boryana]